MEKKRFLQEYQECFEFRMQQMSKREADIKTETMRRGLKKIRQQLESRQKISPGLYTQLAKYGAAAYKKKNPELQNEVSRCVSMLAGMDFSACMRHGYSGDFLEFLVSDPRLITAGKPLREKYEQYVRETTKDQIQQKVQTDPTVEFSETRQMERHFILHIGPTNSGKTYSSLERLKEARNGVYLSPLRLLALEVYDRMTAAGVPCSMLTGEEHIETENHRVISQTIETADLDMEYDIAVIDEGQMLADEFRGAHWVRAIMGIRCKEIHVCASPDAKDILKKIIKKCADTYEVVYHNRKTPLLMDKEPFPLKETNLLPYIHEGDAFIVFSKRSVLDLAARFEMQHIRASVIYGNLPPEIRKEEVRKFVEHETDVVISTDAIGMGLNLPIRRIIFAETKKFDGRQRRYLNASEILQIAGRAGRYGLYDEGYVTGITDVSCEHLSGEINRRLPPIQHARLAFPKVLLGIDKDLDDILRMWKALPDVFPYKKIEITEMLTLYRTLKKETDNFRKLPDGNNREVLYEMVSCPLDVKNADIVALWVHYCIHYQADISLDFPMRDYVTAESALEQCETYYRMLDLYHVFSLRMGKVIDEDRLRAEKDKVDLEIMEILGSSKRNYIKTCKYCGKVLPIDYEFGICQKCFKMDRWAH